MRRGLIILGIAFIACRVFTTTKAFEPINVIASGDVAKYETWAGDLIDWNRRAYEDVSIEYPPGSLPFITAPKFLEFAGDDYRDRFVWMMALVDLVGFVGTLVMANRHGSLIGPALWILGGLLLGPVIYLRLDLVPAVATIWALERASAGAWTGTGALLGFGAVAKVYPAFLIVPALFAVPRRKPFLIAAGVIVGAMVLPIFLIGAGPELIRDVVEYHGLRGIQIESTWGALSLVASHLDLQVQVSVRFGAYEALSSISQELKSIALLASLVSLAIGTRVVAKRVPRGDGSALALALYGTLALLMFSGTVFSPQYGIWLLAIGAAAACWPRPAREVVPLALMLVIAGLTQRVFPYAIGNVVQPFFEGGTEAGDPVGLATLVVRNLLVLVAGVLALRAVRYRSLRKEISNDRAHALAPVTVNAPANPPSDR